MLPLWQVTVPWEHLGQLIVLTGGFVLIAVISVLAAGIKYSDPSSEFVPASFCKSTASCLRFCAVCEEGLQKEGADLCKSSFSSERGLHMALNTTDFSNSFLSLITSAGSTGGAAPFL